jgi:hypothetical protein
MYTHVSTCKSNKINLKKFKPKGKKWLLYWGKGRGSGPNNVNTCEKM